MKILLADDDPEFLDAATFALRREGYNVIVATSGATALDRWRADSPDLVLLDVCMPAPSGLEVCQEIRARSQTPVIMLTGMADEEHVIQGLQDGADDYITKPFSPKQLSLRMRAVLRRTAQAARRSAPPEAAPPLRVGDFVLDTESHRVTKADTAVYLTPREFRILSKLATNAGHVVSFDRLVEAAWGHAAGQPAMLKTHIFHLRKKLRLSKGQPGYIRVAPKLGYVLERQ